MSTVNDIYQTRAWKKFVYFFGEDVNAEELRSLATVVSMSLYIELTNEQKRTKANLIRWFDYNYDIVFPWMQENITITLQDGSTINLKDKNK